MGLLNKSIVEGERRGAVLYIFPEFIYPMPMMLSELGAPLVELKAKIDETWGRL
jgi:hypothetical protein